MPAQPCGVVRAARVTAEEVGFTREGLSLGMPMRPAWRGVVKTPEQLHALEEKSFADFCARLQERYGERLSYFEPRLEFWRQLWRVLERSDIALMIVDARCVCVWGGGS